MSSTLAGAQRGRSVVLGGAGVIGAVLVFSATLLLVSPEGARADPASRLALGAASLLPCAAVFLAMLLAQMIARFATGTFDPTAGEDSRFLRVNQRVITNTVEQLACFIPAMLALSVATAPVRMGLVVALSVTFALARIAFWVGYLRAPLLRAPGMAATFAVTVTALVCALWAWL